jgi:hypothetical protein
VETKPATLSKPDLGARHSADGDWRKFCLVFILVLVLGGLAYFLAANFSSNETVNESATEATATGGTLAKSAKPQAELEQSPAVPEKPQTTATGQAQSDESEAQLPAQVSAPPDASAAQQDQDHRNLPAIPSSGASLRMLALGDSSLIIKVDTRKPQQYNLYDGLDLTWKIKQRVNVEFAASDVARFWLNGEEIDIAGDESFTLQLAGE